MAQVQLVKKARRWDKPFGRHRLRPEVVQKILSLPIFRDIDGRLFPQDLPLTEIIANDARILRYSRSETIYRQGEYGNSLFMILDGAVHISVTSRDKQDSSQEKSTRRKTILESLSPASRRTSKEQHSSSYQLGRYHIFGESEALTRTQRRSTVVPATDQTVVFELRWPGVRDIRHWSDPFHGHIDRLYRMRSLLTGLRQFSLFDSVDQKTLEIIAKYSQFKTYGRFNWTHRFQREIVSETRLQNVISHEQVIAEEGDYLDDLILVFSGLARTSEKLDQGERTTGHLTSGDTFALAEIIDSINGRGDRTFRQSLRAMGYADIVRIPVRIFEKHILPTLAIDSKRSSWRTSNKNLAAKSKRADKSHLTQAAIDFAIDNRFVNGTKAMIINTDRCVNCDDCVRACASTHDNIPRFVRKGVSHGNMMVTNACMHCLDPVCLIDCPTGAINRDSDTGDVVIDEATCVGCTTCANACPYNNIQMEEIRNSSGAFLINEEGVQVLKAIKCDFCSGQSGGPACQRACPHDALIRIDIKDSDLLPKWLKRTH